MATSGRMAGGGHTDRRSLSCLRLRPEKGHLQVWYTALALRVAACIPSEPARLPGRVAHHRPPVLCRSNLGQAASERRACMSGRLSIHVGVQLKSWCCAQAALMSLSCMCACSNGQAAPVVVLARSDNSAGAVWSTGSLGSLHACSGPAALLAGWQQQGHAGLCRARLAG